MDNERIAYLELASGLQSVVNVWDLIEAAKQIEKYVGTPTGETVTDRGTIRPLNDVDA